MRTRVVAASALVLIALAGCSPAAPTPTEPPESASPSATPTPTPSEEADGGGGGGDSAPCTRDNLTIVFDETDSSAGHRHGILTFANSSGVRCTLEGYPIVFMGSSEVAAPVGTQAIENATSTPVLISLNPGNEVSAALTITQAGIVEGCTVVTSTHLVVAPPLDHPFVWEDDGRHVPTPAIDSCQEQDIGLLAVGPFIPA